MPGHHLGACFEVETNVNSCLIVEALKSDGPIPISSRQLVFMIGTIEHLFDFSVRTNAFGFSYRVVGKRQGGLSISRR